MAVEISSHKTFDKIAAAHPGRAPDGSTVNFVMRINPIEVSTGVGDHSLILYKVNSATRSRTQITTIKMKKVVPVL